MTDIKISVILPNYNSEKYIGKAIDSFLLQKYLNKELIIVDGKSNDGSHDIIAVYTGKYSNIMWVKEKDKNVTDAINIGLKHCTGDFISFLASDVYYYSDDVFSTICCNYQLIQFDGIYFDYYAYNPTENRIALLKSPNIPFTKNNLITYGTIAGFDNIFISKKVYENYRYDPDYNLCSDWEFFLRITQEYSLFMHVEKIATINVQDGNNLSSKYGLEQMRQIEKVAKKYNTANLRPFFLKEENNFKYYILKFLKKYYKALFR